MRKACRHHPNDGVARAVDHDRTTDYVVLRAEPPLPQPMAEDGNARPFLFRMSVRLARVLCFTTFGRAPGKCASLTRYSILAITRRAMAMRLSHQNRL